MPIKHDYVRCPNNDGVECDRPTAKKCMKCGWNPVIAAKRRAMAETEKRRTRKCLYKGSLYCLSKKPANCSNCYFNPSSETKKYTPIRYPNNDLFWYIPKKEREKK